jgi:small nuclear ribonucleoprotein
MFFKTNFFNKIRKYTKRKKVKIMDLPIKALSKAKGKLIQARLKNGIEYKGRLEQSDNFMNLILEDVEEKYEDATFKYPKAFIKGNNLVFVKID